MSTEKHVSVMKMFTNKLNIGLPQQTREEKRVDGVETHGLSGKRNFRAQQLVK